MTQNNNYAITITVYLSVWYKFEIIRTSKNDLLQMELQEYQDISQFISENIYPKDVFLSENPSHSKKNFRVKASKYQIGKDGKINKVLICKLVAKLFN